MKALVSFLLVAGLLVALGWQSSDGPAEAAGSTPDLAMSIDVDGGGDDCDTRASTPGIGLTCVATAGVPFTVKGYVDSFTGISGTGGYGGIRVRFDYADHMELVQRPTVTELGPAGTPFWPECSSRSETKISPKSGSFWGYAAECHATGPTSTFLGKVVEADIDCTRAGTWQVVLVDAQTFLFDSSHTPDYSDKEGDETLQINCLAAVGGVAELTGGGSSSAASAREGDESFVVPMVAGLAVLVGTSTAAGGVWYVRKRSG